MDTKIAKTGLGCRLIYLSGVVGVSDRAQKSHADFLSPTFTLFYPFYMFHLFLHTEHLLHSGGYPCNGATPK